MDREYGEHWRLGSHLRCVNVNSYLLLLELQTDLNDERGRSNGVLTDGGTLIHRGNQCDFGRGRGRNEFCARGWVGQLLSPRHIDARGQEGAGKHGPGRLLRGLLRPSTLERVSTVGKVHAHTFTQKDGRTRDDCLYCCEIAAAASALRARTRADRTIGGDH